MSISWLGTMMVVCWVLTLVGGLGVHVLGNFDGRKLEAYCRLRRRPNLFGEVLDNYDSAAVSAQYLLHFGLVLGSLAAGAWFYNFGNVEIRAGKLTSAVDSLTIAGWVVGWLFLLTLAGLWIPRILVRDSSSLFIYHSWPLWRGLNILTQPIAGLGDVFAWIGHRLNDNPEDTESEEEMLEDEIRTIVAAGQRDGVFSSSMQGMIQGVMELNEADVEKIMTPRGSVDAIDISSSWETVVEQVVKFGRTRLPVYRDSFDNIIGVLFVKDLLNGLSASNQYSTQRDQEAARPLHATPFTTESVDAVERSFDLESVLRKAWFIPKTRRVDELLQMFLHNRNHMAIVIDDYRQVAGVVTIEDALEEIVGEIADELDLEEDSGLYYDEKTHHVEADGKVHIGEIEKMLGVDLPKSDDYDTIGGLIVQRLSEIPTVGTEVETDNLRITVLKASKRMIQRVRIEIIQNSPETT
ncbi:MAG: hemolysin family protein [Aureliella sp.]